MESSGRLNQYQSGFRNGRGCLDQIMRLQDQIIKSIGQQGYTLAVFIDLEKAFDLMWADGLLLKLRNLGVGRNLYCFVRAFLSGRSMQVKVGNVLSKIVSLENGSPQGSVISPLLFLILMNDYPADPTSGCQLSLFADDFSAWKSGPNLKHITKCLQLYLNRIFEWCETWGLKISMSKTACILFTDKLNVTPIALTLNGII